MSPIMPVGMALVSTVPTQVEASNPTLEVQKQSPAAVEQRQVERPTMAVRLALLRSAERAGKVGAVQL